MSEFLAVSYVCWCLWLRKTKIECVDHIYYICISSDTLPCI